MPDSILHQLGRRPQTQTAHYIALWNCAVLMETDNVEAISFAVFPSACHYRKPWPDIRTPFDQLIPVEGGVFNRPSLI